MNDIRSLSWVEDGMSFTELPKKFADEAYANGWIENSDNKKTLRFCGYAEVHGDHFFSLPKTTLAHADSVEKKVASARLIFRSIAKYSSQKKNSQSTVGEQIDVSDIASLSRILLFQEILDDWVRHGVYRWTQQQDKVGNRGKVIWSKTIAKVTPLIDKSNSPIYFQTVSRLKQQSQDVMISKLHVWAVAKADRQIGWLYATGNKSILFEDLTDTSTSIPVEADYAISVLKKRLNQTFDYRSIWLLKTLIRVIEFNREFEGKDQVFGIKSFWSVWEQMCRLKFTTQVAHSTILAMMPRPIHYYQSGETGGTQSRQLPDILEKISPTEMHIKDAKYYDISKNTPSLSDIVKQIFYADSIRKAGLANVTKSVFLLPLPVTATRPVSIKFHDAQGNVLPNTDAIECQYLSVIEVCKGYLHTSHV